MLGHRQLPGKQMPVSQAGMQAGEEKHTMVECPGSLSIALLAQYYFQVLDTQDQTRDSREATKATEPKGVLKTIPANIEHVTTRSQQSLHLKGQPVIRSLEQEPKWEQTMADLEQGGLAGRVHVSPCSLDAALHSLLKLAHQAAQHLVCLGIARIKKLARIKERCPCKCLEINSTTIGMNQNRVMSMLLHNVHSASVPK